ncbi:MAG TPA: cupin domain-containing protein [Candidatus Acidoferrales bacterium]|nr:cupin domain-containing protein [Candidatus Acidoferrales bacterium]
MKTLSSTLLAVLVMAALVFAVAAHTKGTDAQTKFAYWTPQSAQWIEDPDARGTYGVNVSGNASTGNWVMYVKVNPGAWTNWHWHTNSQTMYVVSGTMDYEVRPQPAVKLTPGSYLVVPGHALHNGTCISKEPCTFFIENPLPNDKHMTDSNGSELKTH